MIGQCAKGLNEPRGGDVVERAYGLKGGYKTDGINAWSRIDTNIQGYRELYGIPLITSLFCSGVGCSDGIPRALEPANSAPPSC